MWSSDRRKFLTLLAAASVAACGFSPAFAPGGAGHALRGQVQITDPSDRSGFDYVTRLEERLGRVTAPRYRLNWSLKTEPVGAAVSPTGAINRYTLTGRATYSLLAAESGRVVASGEVSSFTSWGTSGTTLASVTSEQDAYRRLAIILADQTVARLIAAHPQ